MEQFPNDALDAHHCHGDVVLQFCSNTAETNIHALRDILKHTPDLLAPRWKIDGFLPPHTIKKLGKETVRNLLGFKDGTANLDASDEKLMNEIVWVAAERGRAGLDGRRNLSGRPHHPHVRRALGSHRADRAADRSSAAKRRAARRSPTRTSTTRPIMPPIRRASASRSPPTSASPIRARPGPRRTAFCAGATIIRAG